MIEDISKVVILALIEGVTEFLPISSTGHLIVGAAALNFDAMVPPIFEIFIQIGAVVAVLLYYRRPLREQASQLRHPSRARAFWLPIAVASLPVSAFGIVFQRQIESLFFSAGVVAASLILGGAVILLVERLPRFRGPEEETARDMTCVSMRQAALIGLAQVFALVPGMSRSGSSIVGGMLAGLDRRSATEFSFFLAIPLLGGATLYKFITTFEQLEGSQVLLLLLGAALSALFAWLAIDWLLRFIARHSFVAFGYYRIVAGIVILLAMSQGLIG